jgi:hypothetical protein
MVQKYELEYDEQEPKEVKEKDIIDVPKDDPLGDVYDVYGMVSNVHSKITGMTRDYVLAQYTSEVINSKFPKFVREQRKTLRVVKSFLIVPLEELKNRYEPVYAEKVYRLIWKIYKDIEELLLGEIDEMVIISRAGKGEVTKAMLLHGRTKEEREEFDSELVTGVGNKLMEKSK